MKHADKIRVAINDSCLGGTDSSTAFEMGDEHVEISIKNHKRKTNMPTLRVLSWTK